MNFSRTTQAAALAVLAAMIGSASLADDAGKPPSDEQKRTIEVDNRSVYDAPERALDPRIDPSRITESEPPPLPEMVVLPMPPDHRISASADEVPISEAHWKQAVDAIEKGLAYLRSSQDDRGAWMHETRTVPTDQPDAPSPIGVAVTALAVKGFVQSGGREAMQSETVQRALRYIRRAQRDDGSFEGGALTNYVTSSVVMALASLDDPDYQDNIREAVRWLQSNQWAQEHGVSAQQDWFGGAGYGDRGRPDMSNTQLMLDALYDAGLSPDEPAFQRALAFVSRAQNLRETNKSEWAGDDGGFIYTPAGGGESFASEQAGEGRFGELVPEDRPRSLRSYGSMTYAGFKSMVYAGLSVDDIRVRAAFDWIRRNFSFDENPGMGLQGLYYYYHTMARALRVAQQNVITDADGEQHNWREELIEAIVTRQRDDGSWQNVADRWLEGFDDMATVYAVLSLQEAVKPVTMME
jgi:squalene-hopene/tetraprenyl-beta-curcumene cyclase